MTDALETVLPVFIGYDTRESEAYDVCRFSLLRRSSRPVYLRPIKVRTLKHIGMYRRQWYERDGQRIDFIDRRPFSTEFAFSRFLVPSLAQFQGWALFCDCDFLWRADIAELFEIRDDRYAVMVVKHRHEPAETVKMDGQVQQRYHRKNWSSLILWNCAHPSNLRMTPHACNVESGQALHAFGWLEDAEIGELHVEWNWLEGTSDPGVDPKAVHFTRGGPWFADYADVDYADEWRDEFAQMKRAAG